MYNSINIVIPVYNEGENIINTLTDIETKVSAKHHIFIIYDFDEDNTLTAVKSYTDGKGDLPISLIKNKYGKGVLNAIKTGFECVDEGVILVTMADLSDDMDSIDDMFDQINQGYDVVCGSRYIKGGGQIGGRWFKKSLSRMAGISLHYLTGIPTHDITNSFKMYTKKVLNDISIESTGGFEVGMEIVLKAYFKGYKIAEVPTVWRDRSAGQSRFLLWKWLPKYLRWYSLGIRSRFRSHS